MQGDPQVIDFLNKALTNELTAINQYWLHYRVLKNWGIEKLAEYERHESIDEMKHADTLADRILFLEGLPNFQAIHKLKVGETVEEILKADLALEMEAIPLLKDAIRLPQENTNSAKIARPSGVEPRGRRSCMNSSLATAAHRIVVSTE